MQKSILQNPTLNHEKKLSKIRTKLYKLILSIHTTQLATSRSLPQELDVLCLLSSDAKFLDNLLHSSR